MLKRTNEQIQSDFGKAIEDYNLFVESGMYDEYLALCKSKLNIDAMLKTILMEHSLNTNEHHFKSFSLKVIKEYKVWDTREFFEQILDGTVSEEEAFIQLVRNEALEWGTHNVVIPETVYSKYQVRNTSVEFIPTVSESNLERFKVTYTLAEILANFEQFERDYDELQERINSLDGQIKLLSNRFNLLDQVIATENGMIIPLAVTPTIDYEKLITIWPVNEIIDFMTFTPAYIDEVMQKESNNTLASLIQVDDIKIEVIKSK